MKLRVVLPKLDRRRPEAGLRDLKAGSGRLDEGPEMPKTQHILWLIETVAVVH